MKTGLERLPLELAEVRKQSRGCAVGYPKSLRESVAEAARKALEEGGAFSEAAR